MSSCDSRFRIENLLEFNYWDAVCVARREIFLKYPYESTTQNPGFGFEDWHFNCQTLAENIEHYVVPDTVHFLRAKLSGSLLECSKQKNRLMGPTKLLKYEILEQKIEQAKSGKFKKIKNSLNQLNKNQAKFLYFIKFLKRFIKYPKRAIREFAHGYPISARETLPEWLFNEWNDINVIEPKLFPDSQLLDSIPFYYINNSTLSKNYIDMCYKYGNDVSHVFFSTLDKNRWSRTCNV